jgi:hypothetical protein
MVFHPIGACRAACLRNFLPLAFAIAFIFALSWPWLGRKVLKPEVQPYHLILSSHVGCLCTSTPGNS